ncbi:CaiB/BaiF CoA transferase family protein [Aliikangiella sp. IMCC44359]|uniref:CaiB/BaiF CoA transferase family protein n=1 Tax=Aliikangiella sp. IMCC44359 TaxID=3459125 RepID=UPI00403AA53F
MTKPFENITVLDLTHVLAGPFSTYQLAILGAKVIKIEPPGSPDCVRGRGPDQFQNKQQYGINFRVQNSNKKALSLNLKSVDGQSILKKLARTADVLVENYRVGVLNDLGLGYEAIKAINPQIIYCSITGFGQNNSRSSTNAYDNIIQAACGVMQKTGNNRQPIKTAASFVDYATGYSAAFAISAAIYQRSLTNQGQYIDCAMLDTALTLMAPEVSAELYQQSCKTQSYAPQKNEAGLGYYQTKKGQIMLGAFNFRQNNRLWQYFNVPEWSDLDSWEQLWLDSEAMRIKLTHLLLNKTAQEWEQIFHQIGIPAEQVRSVSEAVSMPHLEQRALFHELPQEPNEAAAVKVPVAPFSYSHNGPQITSPPPKVGQDNQEILASLGFNKTEIEQLKSDRII